MSLKGKIENFLQDSFPNWINGGEIERVAMRNNYKASNASRRCRELENDGKIEKRLVRGFVEYRWLKNQQFGQVNEPIRSSPFGNESRISEGLYTLEQREEVIIGNKRENEKEDSLEQRSFGNSSKTQNSEGIKVQSMF